YSRCVEAVIAAEGEKIVGGYQCRYLPVLRDHPGCRACSGLAAVTIRDDDLRLLDLQAEGLRRFQEAALACHARREVLRTSAVTDVRARERKDVPVPQRGEMLAGRGYSPLVVSDHRRCATLVVSPVHHHCRDI